MSKNLQTHISPINYDTVLYNYYKYTVEILYMMVHLQIQPLELHLSIYFWPKFDFSRKVNSQSRGAK
jgi:hypothetical protein